MNKKIPLIKEYRIQRLTKCLECFDKFAYHREKQRDCVLELYSNTGNKTLEHREKSIFRGMVIPSLRYLELIIGFGDIIKPSANGKLIIESQFDIELYERCWRAVIFEIDRRLFNFLEIIKQRRFSKNNLIEVLSGQIEGASFRQKKERIEKWLSILHQIELIKYSMDVSLNENNYKQVLLDIDANLKNLEKFCDYVIDEYYKLGRSSAGIVDIRELREAVALMFLKERHILTEEQFDHLLRKFITTTPYLHISLGEPMGADQKLFKYKGKFYKTIIMKRKEVLK